MHHTDPVIGAFADDMRFLEQQALRDGFTAAQWRHYWGWNSIALAQVRAAAQQTAPIYPMWAFAPYAPMSAFVDALNAVIDAQHPEWDETSAHAAWQLQCQELMALANQIPPDVRADTTRFPWLNDASVNDVIRMQTNHSTEHYEKSVAEQAYDTALAAFRTMYKRWTAYAATPDADAALFTHLWAWQTISQARLIAGRDGHPPVYPTWPTTDPDTHAVIDDINAWIVATHGTLSRDAAIARWDAGYRAMLQLCADMPAAAYSDPARTPWLNGYVLLDVVRGSLEHHREHLEG